jgi:hypothetical protein
MLDTVIEMSRRYRKEQGTTDTKELEKISNIETIFSKRKENLSAKIFTDTRGKLNVNIF